MADAPAKTDTVTLTIDGRELQVPKGTLVIRAAEQLGIIVPRFCDHPLLDPVAACRQCLVEVEGQRKPMTACSTQCTDGMVVKTHLTSEIARKGQEGQLEFLLINHPLDCPQCDKGGECPLQDQALAHGAPDSRFIDDKRRYEKPIPISPQILLDRERCVLCARCTRFSQEISGDPFIELFERGALEQVAIYEDEPYHSYYSGNIVQICPVGALTADSYRFGARPFDLKSSASICNQCSNGCNLRVDTRRGEIQRQLAWDNMAINETWNCDKGRFGFEYVHHPDRLREPAVRDDLGRVRPTAWIAALGHAADGLKAALDAGGPPAVGILTGGRITDEDAYAVSRFARDVLGTDNVDFRLRPRTEEERDVLAAVAGTVGPTYDDVEHAPLVVIAGLDSEEEAPILHLRLRKAVRRHRQRIVVVGPVLGSLAEIAWRWIPTAAGQEATVLAALSGQSGVDVSGALALVGGEPATAVDDPRAAGVGTGPATGSGPHPEESLSDAARAVEEPGGSLVILAGERLALSRNALRAAAGLAIAKGGQFAWVPRRTNARGAVDAGLMPGLLPGGRRLMDAGAVGSTWARVPETEGLDTRGMLEAAARGDLKALYCIGVDPVRDFEDPVLAETAIQRVDTLIVQDLLPTDTTRYADVLLPAASSQERVGSFTTWEGRRQPFGQALHAQGLAQQDWDIVRQLARFMGADLGWESAKDVRREAAPLMEATGPALDALPISTVAGTPAGDGAPANGEMTAVVLDYLLGYGSMLLGAKALNETARPGSAWISPRDAVRLGVTDTRTVAVIGPEARMELPVTITAGVAEGVIVLPANSTTTPAGVVTRGAGPVRVRVEPVAAAAQGEA